jgi:hypothetical protein
VAPTADDREAHEPQFYAVVEGDAVEALRTSKNDARSRWRMTHVQLDSAVRRDVRDPRSDAAPEAHAEHLAALLQWRNAEAAFIAARLGFAFPAAGTPDA